MSHVTDSDGYVSIAISMPKARAGGKITRSHTTTTDAANIVVRVLAKMPEVTKISLGIITPARGGKRGLKCLPITGGIKIVVRGIGAVQDLFVYTSDSASTQKKVEGIFQ